MEEFVASVEPKLSLANVGDDVEFLCSEMHVEDGMVDSGPDSPHLIGADYGWEASPVILQDGRFELTDQNHVLRILDLQPSDNNTDVICHIDGTYAGQTYRTVARGMIQLRSNLYHVTSNQDGVNTQPSVTYPDENVANISVRNESATSLDQASLTPLSVFIVGSALLIILMIISALAYRRRSSSAKKNPLKRNLRGAQSTISRENSYQSTKFNTAQQPIANLFANIEGSKPSTSFSALPVVSVTEANNEQDLYAVPGECESNTVPSRKRSKRYLSPTNNKRRHDNHSHVYGRVANSQDGEYECMDGNPRLRNCVSQPNLEDHQEHRYVNWKQSRSDTRFSAPIYSTQINQNANTNDQAVTVVPDSPSVEYAELDLCTSSGVIHGRNRESSGSVTQYAKILRILSVFRTNRSTRVKVTNLEQV